MGGKAGTCKKCHVDGPMTTDHIFEKTDGGNSEDANKQELCVSCHSTKTKIFQLRRNQAGRKLTEEESLELNRMFHEDKFGLKQVARGNRLKSVLVLRG